MLHLAAGAGAHARKGALAARPCVAHALAFVAAAGQRLAAHAVALEVALAAREAPALGAAAAAEVARHAARRAVLWVAHVGAPGNGIGSKQGSRTDIKGHGKAPQYADK